MVNIQRNIVTCPTYPDNSYETCCTVCASLGCNCHTVVVSTGWIRRRLLVRVCYRTCSRWLADRRYRATASSAHPKLQRRSGHRL